MVERRSLTGELSLSCVRPTADGWPVSTNVLQLLLEHCDFLNIDISQGSVATRLRCGGIFKNELVANLPVSLPVKEFWKSVNIWGSYGQEFGVLFFWDTVYIYILLDAAYWYRCNVVSLCVCLLVTTVSPTKAAEQIEVPLGTWTWFKEPCIKLGPRSSQGRGNFGGHFRPFVKHRKYMAWAVSKGPEPANSPSTPTDNRVTQIHSFIHLFSQLYSFSLVILLDNDM